MELPHCLGLSGSRRRIRVCHQEQSRHVSLLNTSISAQPASGVPQIQIRREERQRQGSEGTKRPLICVSKISGAIGSLSKACESSNNRAENATTLIEMLILSAIFIGMYAFLKRVGWFDDDRNYHDNSKQPQKRPQGRPTKCRPPA
ncbi:MAG TPA: hypothetical protein VGJ20_01640 [Xanthobacteraceae bacterium]